MGVTFAQQAVIPNAVAMAPSDLVRQRARFGNNDVQSSMKMV